MLTGKKISERSLPQRCDHKGYRAPAPDGPPSSMPVEVTWECGCGARFVTTFVAGPTNQREPDPWWNQQDTRTAAWQR